MPHITCDHLQVAVRALVSAWLSPARKFGRAAPGKSKNPSADSVGVRCALATTLP